MEMQIKNLHTDEAVAWFKILENIISVVDPAKQESLTDGEWRSQIARCLLLLLQNSGEAYTWFLKASA